MQDLKLLSLSDLLDLMIERTNYNAQLRAFGATPDQLMVNRVMLRNLHAEIELRNAADKTDQSTLPSQEDDPPLEMAS